MKAIVGRKIGMTQLFTNDGKSHSVTVIEVLPNVITQIKTVATDGYDAVQVGYEELKENRANQPEKGIFAKAGTTPKQNLFEIPVADVTKYKVGDHLDVSIFQPGDVVDVIGVSKGKGFSGAIKRWHYTIGAKAPRRRLSAPDSRFHGDRRSDQQPDPPWQENGRPPRSPTSHDS
jgi:large subunit ribosomal protein L3